MVPFSSCAVATAFAPPFTNNRMRQNISRGNRAAFAVRYSGSTLTGLQMVYAPPGSGYFQAEDEETELPSTYEPMMEYPGTMRPTKARENMPYEDLPIDEDGPPPVPWPHFQDIPHHHTWGAAHETPTPINTFIEQLGRWATLEDEAETIRQTRRAIREQKAAQAAQKADEVVVMDDDTEDDDEEEEEFTLEPAVFDAQVISSNVQNVQTVKKLEDDGDFLLEELGLDMDEGYTDTKQESTVAANDEFDFGLDDLGLDDESGDGDDEESSVEELGDDITLDEDGVIEGADKGRIDPNVPDDYEADNDNVDGFDGFSGDFDDIGLEEVKKFDDGEEEFDFDEEVELDE